MAWHSFKEAVLLTGRSRRSIYRDISAGRVSSDIARDGQRRFETSELIRAYGPLLPVAQADPVGMAQVVTPDLALLLAEVKSLRQEVKELRDTLLLLEHVPASPQPAAPRTTSAPVTWSSLVDALND